jgi:hypothetical protein
MLRATDRQVIDLRASVFINGVNLHRRVRREVHGGGPETLTLPEPLGQVTFVLTGDQLVATASSLPDHDQIFLSRQSDVTGGGLNAHAIVVSRSFREALRTPTIILDLSDVPDFQPSWRIDLASQRFLFTAIRGLPTDNMVFSSELFLFAPATQARSGSGRTRAALWPGDAVRLPGEYRHILGP